MDSPKVSIVTPVYNRLEYTRAYLNSLRKVDYPNFEVVIVDDASNDGSYETISIEYPEVILLRGNGNLWWAGGTNTGIRYALENGTDYILTLNNDVEVDSAFLTALVRCAEENPKSLVGAKIYNYHQQNEVTYFGGVTDWKKGEIYHICGRESDDPERFSKLQEAEWLTGMGILIKASYFNDIGFFDAKKFPQYAADADFTMRARQKGYRLLVEPKSIIWNKVESTGVQLSQNHFSNLFIKALFSLRSTYHLKTNFCLYWRHCPRRYFVRALFMLYARFYYSRIKASVLRLACKLTQSAGTD
ncbi:MAG: glycosyltransferase family 2 protein [Firmicutes bacterium]|nr:glycosyltransferase family 2 protein [Bacillota bacterium]